MSTFRAAAISAALFALTTSLSAPTQAAAISVGFTVTGSPGRWEYNFAFDSRSLTEGLNLYRVGLDLPGGMATAGPGNFQPLPGTWSSYGYGGSDRLYNLKWLDENYGRLPVDRLLDGFRVVAYSEAPLGEVPWFAFTYSASGTVRYEGSDSFSPGNTPAFEGVSRLRASDVPEPLSLALLTAGALGLVASTRRPRSRV